jgi:hypothetical protein
MYWIGCSRAEIQTGYVPNQISYYNAGSNTTDFVSDINAVGELCFLSVVFTWWRELLEHLKKPARPATRLRVANGASTNAGF